MSALTGNFSIEEKILQKGKVAKPMLWLAIVSMIMLFAGITSAYIVRQAKGDWMKFELPWVFWISTAILMFSSITMNIALQSAKKNKFSLVTTALLLTLVLGIGFMFSQYYAWTALYANNIVFAGKYSNASGSFLYVITGLHLVHLLAGIISLIVVLVKALVSKYHADNILGLQLCSIYWHFLDVIWIYLFLFLLFVG